MTFVNVGRLSDAPYVESIWHGSSGVDHGFICPVDGRWNLIFTRHFGRVDVSVQGPMTKAMHKIQPEGAEWLVIKFRLGAFMPNVPIQHLVDDVTFLPPAAHRRFWLKGAAWAYPDFENADTFVNRLIRAELIVNDPVVHAMLNDETPGYSIRTIRRRFLQATGLPYKTIHQIERARRAVALLEKGTSILDTVHQLGYFDQPHLTNSLRHYMGQTPAEIVRTRGSN